MGEAEAKIGGDDVEGVLEELNEGRGVTDSAGVEENEGDSEEEVDAESEEEDE